MTDRSRIRVRVASQEFPNFKEALRSMGILDKTTSSQRTRLRKGLKSGHAVTVCDISFEPLP
jgi:hypothetical protein